MKRKSFLLLILLLISLSTVCFANNMGNDVKNAVNGATNTVVDGVQNLTEDVRNGIGAAENTIEDGARNIGDAVMDGANDFMNAEDDYTATRTGAEDVSIINNTVATTWTWIAVAIAALVIVGLVWYYASQHSKH